MDFEGILDMHDHIRPDQLFEVRLFDFAAI